MVKEKDIKLDEDFEWSTFEKKKDEIVEFVQNADIFFREEIFKYKYPCRILR